MHSKKIQKTKQLFLKAYCVILHINEADNLKENFSMNNQASDDPY